MNNNFAAIGLVVCGDVDNNSRMHLWTDYGIMSLANAPCMHPGCLIFAAWSHHDVCALCHCATHTQTTMNHITFGGARSHKTWARGAPQGHGQLGMHLGCLIFFMAVRILQHNGRDFVCPPQQVAQVLQSAMMCRSCSARCALCGRIPASFAQGPPSGWGGGVGGGGGALSADAHSTPQGAHNVGL